LWLRPSTPSKPSCDIHKVKTQNIKSSPEGLGLALSIASLPVVLEELVEDLVPGEF
jgi:hypothetical protein